MFWVNQLKGLLFGLVQVVIMVADLLAVGGDFWLPQFQLHSDIKFFF